MPGVKSVFIRARGGAGGWSEVYRGTDEQCARGCVERFQRDPAFEATLTNGTSPARGDVASYQRDGKPHCYSAQSVAPVESRNHGGGGRPAEPHGYAGWSRLRTPYARWQRVCAGATYA